MNLDIRENEKLGGFFLQSKSLFEDEEAGLGTLGGLPSSQGFVLALTPSWGWAGQGVGRWEQGVWRLGAGGGGGAGGRRLGEGKSGGCSGWGWARPGEKRLTCLFWVLGDARGETPGRRDQSPHLWP